MSTSPSRLRRDDPDACVRRNRDLGQETTPAASSGTTQAIVVRGSDRTPAANAMVQLVSTGCALGAPPLYATADEEGRFHFNGAVAGAHLLSATAEGLATEQPVNVIAEVGRAREEIAVVWDLHIATEAIADLYVDDIMPEDVEHWIKTQRRLARAS